MKKIPYVNLGYKKKSKKGLIKIFEKVLEQGQFVGGKEILKFEKIFQNFVKLNML